MIGGSVRAVMAVFVGLLLVVVATGVALAQEPADLEAKFGGMTVADLAAAGYIQEGPCVSAELVGAPPALGAMGQHHVNHDLVDGELDALNPEVVLTHPETTEVTAIEYLVLADAPPTIFGQTFVPGPPDIPGSFALHLWFFDNPSGQFADFNPNISCPVPTLISLPQAGGASATPAAIGLVVGLMLLAGGALLTRDRLRTAA